MKVVKMSKHTELYKISVYYRTMLSVSCALKSGYKYQSSDDFEYNMTDIFGTCFSNNLPTYFTKL